MCAKTPAAKGRVERAHGALQDRLVKEMRLEGISSMSDANAWIDGFVESYNMRFSKPPAVPINAHRPVKVLYPIDPSPENQRLAGKRVNVIDYPDGRIAIRYEGRDLAYREFDKLTQVHQGEVVPNKRLGAMLKMVANFRDEKRSLKGPTRRYPAPARLT